MSSDVEQREQHDAERDRGQRQCARRPEEIDAFEEADEQRRIAERRQRAADVADEQDEEDDRMRAVPPASLPRGAAGSAASPRPSCPSRSRARRPRQQRGVARRRAARVWPRTQMPPAIVYSANSTTTNGTYSSTIACTTWCTASPAPNAAANGTSEHERPRQRDLAVMVVPELRRDERDDRDRQQQAGERQAPEERQRRAVERGRQRRGSLRARATARRGTTPIEGFAKDRGGGCRPARITDCRHHDGK